MQFVTVRSVLVSSDRQDFSNCSMWLCIILFDQLLYINRTITFLCNPHGSSPNHLNGIYHRPNGKVLLTSYLAHRLIGLYPPIEQFQTDFTQCFSYHFFLLIFTLFLTLVKVFLTVVQHGVLQSRWYSYKIIVKLYGVYLWIVQYISNN